MSMSSVEILSVVCRHQRGQDSRPSQKYAVIRSGSRDVTACVQSGGLPEMRRDKREWGRCSDAIGDEWKRVQYLYREAKSLVK